MIEIDSLADSRGFFARLWCKQEFKDNGIDIDMVQASISYNEQPGTLRGLHFQWPPSSEAKLVRCQRGRIHDVVVDLRPDSPTFTKHAALELDSCRHHGLYIPPGCAHGFQTLEADSEIVYMMSDIYRPDLQGGVRYDDPTFNIAWPLTVSSVSDRDRECPDFDRETHSRQYTQMVDAQNLKRAPDINSTD